MKNFRLFGTKPKTRLCAGILGATMVLTSLTGCTATGVTQNSYNKETVAPSYKAIITIGDKSYIVDVVSYNTYYYGSTTSLEFKDGHKIDYPSSAVIVYPVNSDEMEQVVQDLNPVKIK